MLLSYEKCFDKTEYLQVKLKEIEDVKNDMAKLKKEK